jgi:hypothetical protein
VEHSDRGRYVTDQVKLWIVNDGEFIGSARTASADPAWLEKLLAYLLHTAAEGSAPWHVAQELAPNDYTRINWAEIAEELRGE